MSRSPYFFVERYDNHTKKYELQHPIVWNWNHTKQEKADLFPYNGCHDLFSIVEDHGSGDLPEMKGIHRGLPKGTCKSIRECFNECSYTTKVRDFWSGDETGETKIIRPDAYWFTYADMYIYLLENPKVVDYEAMDEVFCEDGEEPPKIMKDNPVYGLKNRVDAFLEVMDGWEWDKDRSLIRIVFWIL